MITEIKSRFHVKNEINCDCEILEKSDSHLVSEHLQLRSICTKTNSLKLSDALYRGDDELIKHLVKTNTPVIDENIVTSFCISTKSSKLIGSLQLIFESVEKATGVCPRKLFIERCREIYFSTDNIGLLGLPAFILIAESNVLTPVELEVISKRVLWYGEKKSHTIALLSYLIKYNKELSSSYYVNESVLNFSIWQIKLYKEIGFDFNLVSIETKEKVKLALKLIESGKGVRGLNGLLIHSKHVKCVASMIGVNNAVG